MNLVSNRKDESQNLLLFQGRFKISYGPLIQSRPHFKLYFHWLKNFHGTIFFSKLAIDFPSNSFLLHEAHKSSVMLSNANDCLNWWNIYAGNDGQKLAKLQLDNIGLAQLAASEMTLQEFVAHKCHWTLMAGGSIWKRVIRKLYLCFTSYRSLNEFYFN